MSIIRIINIIYGHYKAYISNVQMLTNIAMHINSINMYIV